MNNPTITEAIEAARESTRCAELDIRRAMSLAVHEIGIANTALHLTLEGLVTPVADAARVLARLLQFPAGVTVPATAMADDMAEYRQRIGRAQLESASREPLEQPEPPPALAGSRCQFRRDDGKRCNTWVFPVGDLRHVAEHQHRFPCGGKVPIPGGGSDPCDGDEGHSGPCFQIPF